MIKAQLFSKLAAVGASLEREEQMQKYFPDVTNDHQLVIFNDFKKLKSDEEERFVQFKESLIDPEPLKKFNSELNKAGIFNQFTMDFGGSSLKISTVKIIYSEPFKRHDFELLKQRNFIYSDIDENPLSLSKMEWFKWVAEKMKLYLNEAQLIENCQVPTSTALTFSYPLCQLSADSATVISCNKPFPFLKDNFIGSNVVKDINQEFKEQQINLRVNCVLNDVVATHVYGIAQRHENPVSLIVGTGTNSGFFVSTPNGEKIINSEMAQFKISEDLLDTATKEIIKESPGEYLPLEITVAGMKFVEIVRKAIDNFMRKDFDKIDIGLICKYIGDIDINKDEKEIADLIREISLKFKRRAYRILAPIVVAAAGSKNFTLITNGTVISHHLDSKILLDEIELFIKNNFKESERVSFEIFNDNQASLSGAAFASLAHSQKKVEN